MKKARKHGPIRTSGRWLRRVLLKILILFVIFTFVEVLSLRFVNPPFTVSVAWDWVQHRMNAKKYRMPLYLWQDLNRISPYLRRAVLAGEDQRFLQHHGFDFIEARQALKDILFADRVRGASTISMQVARTVYLIPQRTVSRKLAEAYYAMLIELLWQKQRILEIYLNTVDWGTGVMGAEAASVKYFRTHADRLTPSQAVLLAAILPSPHKWSPVRQNADVVRRYRKIMRQIHAMPLISWPHGG